jgi:hypothetical protein
MNDSVLRTHLTRLGPQLRAAVIARGYTVSSFADRCNYDEKTVRNAFLGRCRVDTMSNLCKELDVPFNLLTPRDDNCSTGVSAELFGSYPRKIFGDYAGTYEFVIGDGTERHKLPTGSCEIYWCDEINGLRFNETFYLRDACSGRTLEECRSGDVHIHARISLINLISIDTGNVRLVTLTNLSPNTGTMGGVVLMPRWSKTHYLPAAMPIIYHRLPTGTPARSDAALPSPEEAGFAPFDVAGMEEIRANLRHCLGDS